MACVRKDHRDRWIAEHRDQSGRRRRDRPKGAFENKAQEKRAAHALLERRLKEVERATFTPVAERLTLRLAAQLFLESKVSIRSTTYRSYAALLDLYILPMLGEMRVDQIS